MDWMTAATVIVAVAAIIGILIQFFNKDKPIKNPHEDYNLRISGVESEIKYITERVEALKKKIDEHDFRDQRDFERIENKIEKLTDLMIEIIQKDNNNINTRIIKSKK